MKSTLLVVDDDRLTRETLASALDETYNVLTAGDGHEALAVLERKRVDIVLSDMTMPGLNGLGLLEAINSLEDKPALIFITGNATVETAVQAMKLGAQDYITKPVNLGHLDLVLEKTLETRNLRAENAELKNSLRESNTSAELIQNSPAMKKVIDLALQVSGTDASVLINGESGTGKELIANLIHYNSPRAARPFIKVNCAAFSEGVLESELFGHEKGAFTGSLASRKGRFEMADGGTLFLDEIGDLPPPTQVKLLRFLQERTFERVGGNETIRLIAATNRNLPQRIKTGAFREDLYYRLRVVHIVIPPLRERPEDIDPLIDHFLKRFSLIHHRPAEAVSPEVHSMLKTHTWPGNVRELINCIESMVVMAKGSLITMDDIPDHLLATFDSVQLESSDAGALADMERLAIVNAMDKAKGNKTEAAKALGIGLRTLYRKVEKWGL